MVTGRCSRLALALVLTLVGAAADGAPALAAPPAVGASSPSSSSSSSVTVLGVDAEDLDDQADALTGALRARVRAVAQVGIGDTTSTLALVTAALKCPSKPDEKCLARMGQQLKTDRIVYGWMSRAQKGTVTAEVHLWTRGKPLVTATATYSDGLRDTNDEALRRVAGRLADKLFGIEPAGALTIHAGDREGEIRIDGADSGMLDRGRAVLEVRPGMHTVEVRVPGYEAAVARVDVRPESDLDLELPLQPATPSRPPPPPSHGISGRTALALVTLGAGVVVGVIGTIEAVHFLSLQSDNDADHKTLGAQDFCNPAAPHTSSDGEIAAACARIDDAKTARTTEIVLYSAAGVLLATGAVLLLTDHHASATTSASTRARPRPLPLLVPRVGPHDGGLDVVMRF